MHDMRGSREGNRGQDPALKNHKNIGVHSKFGLDTLKNDKATKPAFHVGPSSTSKRNAIYGQHIIVVIGASLLPSSTKKITTKELSDLDHVGKLSGFAHACAYIMFLLAQTRL